MLICHLLKEKVVEKPTRKCLCRPDSRLTMFVKTLRCARCASGCSHRTGGIQSLPSLTLGWGQQTMKQAITIKTDKSYDRGNTWHNQRNPGRALGWPRAGQGRLWRRSGLSQRGLMGRQEVARIKEWRVGVGRRTELMTGRGGPQADPWA